MKNTNYMCHVSYLRNSKAYDHDFWYTCVKWRYLQVFFLFFEIFIFRTVKGVKGQKWSKMKSNNYICHAPYLRNSIAYDHDFWYSCVKWWYFHMICFFHFSDIFTFWAVKGVKGQKMSQYDKKFCLLQLIYLRNHISWLSFMVLLCKMMMSLAFCFIFSKFWFFGLLGEGRRGKRVKNGPRWEKKICLLHFVSQESYIIWFWFKVLV